MARSAPIPLKTTLPQSYMNGLKEIDKNKSVGPNASCLYVKERKKWKKEKLTLMCLRERE